MVGNDLRNRKKDCSFRWSAVLNLINERMEYNQSSSSQVSVLFSFLVKIRLISAGFFA